MGYAGVLYRNAGDVHRLEQRISLWFAERCPWRRSATDQKYWEATIEFPFNNNDEMFFAVFRYFEEVEKSDCLVNIASAFQISEIYLHHNKLPSMIRHLLRLANRKLRQHLIKEYPMLGRFTTFALVERDPLIRNF